MITKNTTSLRHHSTTLLLQTSMVQLSRLFVSAIMSLFLVITVARNNVVAAEEKFPSTQARGFHWVLAPPGESHASACRGNLLNPTTVFQDIPWGEQVMSEVVAGLGRVMVSASLGLAGCCAPGLWCLPDDTGACYTHSVQDNFVNVGASPKLNVSTVYTCVDITLDEAVTGFLSFTDTGAVELSGANQGLDRDAVDVTINGEQCSDVDLCHTVCQACPAHSCPAGSICFNTSATTSGCFLFCAGNEDTSCPCSTTCRQVNLALSRSSYVATHLCVPADLDCRSYAPPSGSHLQCRAPSVFEQIYNGRPWPNQEQAVGLSINHDATVFSAQLPPPRCSQASDCFDLDARTSDSCSDQGVCVYSSPATTTTTTTTTTSSSPSQEQHGSTLSHVRDRSTPFTYVWFELPGQAAAQQVFEEEVLQRGQKSPVSEVDDFPADFLQLGFSLRFFGHSVSTVAVNPNGVLSLPPFSHCWGLIGGLACPAYSTSSNVVSLWGRDWDPSMDGRKKPSTVYTLRQQRHAAAVLGGVDANAFHVMYSDVHVFDKDIEVRADPLLPNSFSASLYEDGSVRLRFHEVSVEVTSADVFGLWGSRASSPSSPLLLHESSSTRYHQETFNASQLVRAGTDVVFCSLTTAACMPNTCTRAGGVASFSLLGPEPTCAAAGDGLAVWCVWGGGLAVTSPSFSQPAGSNHTLVSCPTPVLRLADNSLVSLDLRLAVNHSAASSSVLAGQKSMFSKHMDSSTGEVVNNHLMVRYFGAADAEGPLNCGCDSLSAPSEASQCDSCLVCGSFAAGGGAPGMRDCNGDCLGAAYVDTCGTCAAGDTGKRPVSSCDYEHEVIGGDDMSTISKTILFLTMMICMTFMFTACLRIVRTSMSAEEEEEGRLGGIWVGGLLPQTDPLRPVPLRRGNGLSRFEVDALGEDEFALMKGMRDVESAASSVYSARHSVANLECAICLSDFEDLSVCRQLPCGHVFHKSCVDEWFVLSVKCPMCKRNIREVLLGDEVPLLRISPSPAAAATAATSSSGGAQGEVVQNPLVELEMSASAGNTRI